MKLLGADPQAKDVARVFRLAGTYISKSATLVQSIFAKLDDVWEFCDLADERSCPSPQSSGNSVRRSFSPRESRKRPREAPEWLLRSRERLEGVLLPRAHQARLEDLERLLKHRGTDELPPGKRNFWMYVAGCSMSFLMGPQSLEKELIALGRRRAGWSEAAV